MVSFDKYGVAYIQPGALSMPRSGNFQKLALIANSPDYFIDVIATIGYDYIDCNGEKKTGYLDTNYTYETDGMLSSIPPPNNEPSTGLTTGEEGWFGKIIFPGCGYSCNSIDSHIKVLICATLSFQGASEAFAHEGLGHAYVFVLSGGDRIRASHGHNSKNGTDSNRELANIIIHAIQEVAKYWIK